MKTDEIFGLSLSDCDQFSEMMRTPSKRSKRQEEEEWWSKMRDPIDIKDLYIPPSKRYQKVIYDLAGIGLITFPKQDEVTPEVIHQAELLSKRKLTAPDENEEEARDAYQNNFSDIVKELGARLLHSELDIIQILEGKRTVDFKVRPPFRPPAVKDVVIMLLTSDKYGYSIVRRVFPLTASIFKDDYCGCILRIREQLWGEMVNIYKYPEELYTISTTHKTLVQRQLRWSAYVMGMTEGEFQMRQTGDLKEKRSKTLHEKCERIIRKLAAKLDLIDSEIKGESCFKEYCRGLRARLLFMVIFRPTAIASSPQHKKFLEAAATHCRIDATTHLSVLTNRMDELDYIHQDDLLELPEREMSFELPRSTFGASLPNRRPSTLTKPSRNSSVGAAREPVKTKRSSTPTRQGSINNMTSARSISSFSCRTPAIKAIKNFDGICAGLKSWKGSEAESTISWDDEMENTVMCQYFG
jgi:hypothetical protein